MFFYGSDWFYSLYYHTMKDKRALRGELNTAEAAEFLGVSEASVRRWGDAGLFPMERVGQRRQRRFRQADLAEFLEDGTQQPAGAATLVAAIGSARVAPGAHLASFFESDAGRIRYAVPFLREGVALGQPCFLIASGDILDGYLAAIKAGLETELAEAVSRGLFVTVPVPGRTVGAALAFWEDRITAAADKGPTIVRGVGDMACVATNFPVQKMLTFEHFLSVLIKRLPAVLVCQYDVRAFDGPSMLAALKAHPDTFEVGLEKLIG